MPALPYLKLVFVSTISPYESSQSSFPSWENLGILSILTCFLNTAPRIKDGLQTAELLTRNQCGPLASCFLIQGALSTLLCRLLDSLWHLISWLLTPFELTVNGSPKVSLPGPSLPILYECCGLFKAKRTLDVFPYFIWTFSFKSLCLDKIFTKSWILSPRYLLSPFGFVSSEISALSKPVEQNRTKDSTPLTSPRNWP